MTPKTTVLALGFAAALGACSSSSPQGGDKVGPQLGQGGADGGINGGGTTGLVIGTGGNPHDITDACAARVLQAEQLPVDMYIMFDQSSSMSAQVPGSNPPASWWQTMQQALISFVNDPRAAGMGVGIQYFPFHGEVDTNNDPSVPSSSCYVPNYVTPEVEVGLLPGNTNALVQSIQSHQPTTFTPTAAALQGAIQHMQAWGPAHPGRQPIVVLATDGYPTECQPQDPSLIAQISDAAYKGTPRIITFVVGFEDAGALDNLTPIAKSGGSSKAFLIGNGDVGKQFVDALLGIAATPLSCSFDVPPSPNPATESINLDVVTVTYDPAATRIPEYINRLNNEGECEGAPDGWYYDAPPPNSKKINMCPQTCAKFAAGTMAIKFACSPGPTGSH